jgi:protein transport protein SEC13
MVSTAAPQPTSFDTQHEDMIHDAQFDYYGKRLATCSSDRLVKIFQVMGNEPAATPLSELRGHEGPVWQVAWAHPKFGSILASCSYDRKIIVWREQQQNQWAKIWEHTANASLNSIAFAPHDFGLKLAAACSDGNILVCSHQPSDHSWNVEEAADDGTPPPHAIGCNAVSWAPAVPDGVILATQGTLPKPTQQFVSGGCDKTVKVWTYQAETQKFTCEQLGTHDDWVRDVAWAPGTLTSTIASCSQDRCVKIWSKQDGQWKMSFALPQFSSVVWRVSWSVSGNILAVSGADNTVTLWKEDMGGKWQMIQTVQDQQQ